MKRRNGRRICLGFQWDSGSWDDAGPWCEYLFTMLGDRKVHWNLPALPPEGDSRKRSALVKAMRDRFEKSGDALTTMGFSGACHPLLNLDELEKELAWGLRNPWGTGITDVLGLRTRVLIPRVPDLVRPDALKLYHDRGFTLIGLSGDPGCMPEARGAGYFSAMRLSVASAAVRDARARVVRRMIASSRDIFLLLDLTGLTGQAQLEHAMEELIAPLLASEGPVFQLIAETPALPSPATPSRRTYRADWSPFPAPVLRARLKATAGIARKRRKKAEEYHDLLSILAQGKQPARGIEAEEKESSNRTRLVAHMLGEVALAGNEFDVKLSGGRFCGITRRGSYLLPSRPAVSYLRMAGKTIRFKTLSSFSFEGENGTGLREELSLEGEGGTALSIEYSFRDDSPLLSVTADISYPKLADGRMVEEYAPLAITLAELPRGGSITVEAIAPDESAASVTLAEDSGWVLLPGAAHRIGRAGGGCILLRFSPHDGRRWGIPFFRVVRAQGRRYLEMNPFGSYAPVPSDVLGGRRESFSLLLGLDNA
jgi:hypothetical protein